MCVCVCGGGGGGGGGGNELPTLVAIFSFCGCLIPLDMNLIVSVPEHLLTLKIYSVK